jgi:hypothetical protein
MTQRPDLMTDDQLQSALRALGRELAWPPARELAATVTSRLAAVPAPADGIVLPFPRFRTVRRSVVLAVAAVLLIAALVAAAALGVPGIRILFGPAPSPLPGATAPTPSASSAVPPEVVGATLGLGRRTTLDEATAEAGFMPRLPADPAIGAPDAVYLEDDRITLVWATREVLPSTAEPSVGLLITEFRAQVNPDAYTKMLDAGTRVERVTVNGRLGYWLSGREHYLFYTDDEGVSHDKAWRVVGEALIWFDGELTYRLESALGRDASIRLAESLSTRQ